MTLANMVGKGWFENGTSGCVLVCARVTERFSGFVIVFTILYINIKFNFNLIQGWCRAGAGRVYWIGTVLSMYRQVLTLSGRMLAVH